LEVKIILLKFGGFQMPKIKQEEEEKKLPEDEEELDGDELDEDKLDEESDGDDYYEE
jgi:hypothetical protein